VRHAELLSQIEVGDEVLTAGGLYGRVRAVADEQVTLEIAPGTEVKVDKRSIAGVVEEPEPETISGDES
jgi:preprotein translocase subunit YajC